MNFFSISDIGKKRQLNEDYLDYLITDDYKLFVVADGMGGHKAGEVASKLAVEKLLEFFESADVKGDLPTDLLRLAINKANQAVFDQAQTHEEMSNMGTTIVIALIVGQDLYIANVGDSRAYVKNSYGFRQVSKDHSLVNEMLSAGTITKEEAEDFSQKNVITRSVGSEETVEANIIGLSIEEGDLVLLCTDGLNTHVFDDEIEEILEEEISIQEMVEDLVHMANDLGGSDNISIILYQDGGEA